MIKEAVEKLRNSTLARNAGWMFMGQGMSVIVQGLYFIVIAHLLGSTEYGVFIGAAAFVQIGSQYSSLGSGMLLVRYVSGDHKNFATYWGNVLLSIFGFGSLVVLIMRLLGPHWLGAPSAAIVLVVAIGDCICGRLAEACGQAFQAFEKLKFTALLTLIVNTFRLLLAVGMTLTMHTATAKQWSFAVLVVSIFAALLASTMVTYHFGRPHFAPHLLRKNAAEGFGYSVSNSTTSIYNDIDKTMLSHYGMSAANGIYAMAYRVVDMATMPIRSIHAAAFPRFFKKGFEGIESTAPYGVKILKKTAIIGITVAVLMFVCAPLIPHVIGKSFSRSILALRWLCILPLFRSFQSAAGDAIIGAGYYKFRTGSQFVAAAVNFGLNLYYIPHYSWVGAAWTSLMTDGGLAVLNWVVLFYLLKRDKKRRLAREAESQNAVSTEA